MDPVVVGADEFGDLTVALCETSSVLGIWQRKCLQVAVAVQGVLDGLGDMQVFTSAVFVDETTALVGCYDGSIYVFQGVLGGFLRTG